MIDYMIEAAGVLISGNKPGDETMITRFVSTDKISIVQDFTASQSALMRGIDSLHIEGGQTAIIDAVYMSAERVGERRKDETGRRRALILLTDGEERSSYYKQSELQKLLRKLDIQIFAIGVVATLSNDQSFNRKSPQENAIKLLDSLTQETGGRAFYPKNLQGLQEASAEISNSLRTQYVIGYQPANASPDGKFRKVKVKLNEPSSGAKRSVHTRSGYFVPDAKGEVTSPSREKSPRLESP